jgi:hypothetical protein
MLDREYWDFRPEWLDYVRRTWEGRGRVEQIKVQTEESLAFRERARKAFDSRGIKFKTVKTYLSTQVPVEGDGYDVDYPHIHYPLYATSLIHYLQPGDVPAPLDILTAKDGEVIETIYPESGLTVFMPHKTWHGARKNHGTENRIQLIATALR